MIVIVRGEWQVGGWVKVPVLGDVEVWSFKGRVKGRRDSWGKNLRLMVGWDIKTE